jgi:hypothetical protein
MLAIVIQGAKNVNAKLKKEKAGELNPRLLRSLAGKGGFPFFEEGGHPLFLIRMRKAKAKRITFNLTTTLNINIIPGFNG